VLTRALEQVGLVDRRREQYVVGSPAFGRGAGLRDQLEGTAVGERLLARVGVEHCHGQQRFRLVHLIAGLAGEGEGLLGVGPFFGHQVRGAAREREEEVHPGGRGHVTGYVGQRVFQVLAEVLAS